MAMIKCNECGKEISSNAQACPECGNVIRKNPYAIEGVLKWILGIILGLVLLRFLFFYF